jgi:hypothetical protein
VSWLPTYPRNGLLQRTLTLTSVMRLPAPQKRDRIGHLPGRRPGFPLLIELIKSDDVESRLKDVDPNKLPGAAEATLKEIKRIKSDSALMALIAGSPNKLIPGLDRPIIEDFLSLTPIYGRKAKLSEEPHVNGEAEK